MIIEITYLYILPESQLIVWGHDWIFSSLLQNKNLNKNKRNEFAEIKNWKTVIPGPCVLVS